MKDDEKNDRGAPRKSVPDEGKASPKSALPASTSEAEDAAELEAMIDEAGKESFPASDPPNWSAVARRQREKARERREKREGKKAA